MRSFLAAILMTALAHAPASSEPTVNLSWSDCGTYGERFATFACNTNAGQNVLVLSFVPPAGMDQFVSCEWYLRFESQGGYGPLPNWWRLRGSTQCRNRSLSADAAFAANGLTHCADAYGGNPSGGITAYQVPYGSVNRARLTGTWVRQDPAPISPDVEYYGTRIVIDHAKTAGTGACDGCEPPAAIYVELVVLTQSAGGDQYLIIVPQGYTKEGPPYGPVDISHAAAGWQCPVQVITGCAYEGGCYANLDFQCATPVQRRRWGAIKSLYR